MHQDMTREELYKLVWSEPMIKVAKDFGMSDRGLAKLCERHGVPVPPRGYWAQAAVGKRVKKPPLLQLGNSNADAIRMFKTDPSIKEAQAALIQKEEAFPPDVQATIAQESLPEHKIRVPKTLSNPHRIVGGWVREEERRRELYRFERDPMMRAIMGSPTTNKNPLEKRRRIILSALFKAIEHRGFSLKDQQDNYGFTISHQYDSIGFTLSERIKQYRKLLTEADRKERRFLSDDQKWTQVREPTGMLRIEIRDSRGYWKLYQYEDRHDLPLEEQLNDVMVGFIKAIWKEKSRRVTREEEQRQRQELQRQREQEEAAIQAELQRKQRLQRRAQSWRQANDLRAYISSVEQKVLKDNSVDSSEKLKVWKEWALAHADELDPLTNGLAIDTETENQDSDET